MRSKMTKMNKGRGVIPILSFMALALLLFPLMSLPSYAAAVQNVTQFIVENVPKTKFVFVPPASMTREGAFDALLNGEKEVSEMKSFNFTTLLMGDILYKARASYIGTADNLTLLKNDIVAENDLLRKLYMQSLLKMAANISPYDVQPLDYSEVFRLTQIITYRKNEANTIIDTLSLMQDKESSFRQRIDTTQTQNLIGLARESFAAERYEEAEDYLAKADSSLSTSLLEYNRLAGLLRISRSILVNYWWQIIAVLALIIAISPHVTRRLKVSRARSRLESLTAERETIKELTIKAQEDCFKHRTITPDTYKVKAEEYRARTTEIEHALPLLEAVVAGEKPVRKPKEESRAGMLEIKEEDFKREKNK